MKQPQVPPCYTPCDLPACGQADDVIISCDAARCGNVSSARRLRKPRDYGRTTSAVSCCDDAACLTLGAPCVDPQCRVDGASGKCGVKACSVDKNKHRPRSFFTSKSASTRCSVPADIALCEGGDRAHSAHLHGRNRNGVSCSRTARNKVPLGKPSTLPNSSLKICHKTLCLCMAVCSICFVGASASTSFEWAAGFPSAAANSINTWTFTKGSAGNYAAATMKVAVIPVADPDRHGVTEKTATANTLLGGSCAGTSPASTISTPLLPSASACYELQFDPTVYQSVFQLKRDSTGAAFVVYGEHKMSEFAGPTFYFKSSTGADLKPEYDSAAATNSLSNGEKWWLTLLSTFLNVLVTFVCVIFLVPWDNVCLCCSSRVQDNDKNENEADDSRRCVSREMVQEFGVSFSSGTMFASAVFLILREANTMISSSIPGNTWLWGTMLMIGFLCSSGIETVLRSLGIEVGHGHSHGSCDVEHVEHRHKVNEVELANAKSTGTNSGNINGDVPSEVKAAVTVVATSAGKDVDAQLAPAAAGPVVNHTVDIAIEQEQGRENGKEQQLDASWRIGRAVFIGDFFHSFVDGVFIGAGFSFCNASMGWMIAATTILHEIPHKMGDFIILTKNGKWNPWPAIWLIMAAASSVVLGGIIVRVSNLSDGALGCTLALSGGTFLYISVIEAGHWLHAKTIRSRVIGFFGFFIGAVLIGLVLINHKHCENKSAEADPHAH